MIRFQTAMFCLFGLILGPVAIAGVPNGVFFPLDKLIPEPVNLGGQSGGLGRSISANGDEVAVGATGAGGHGVVYFYKKINDVWVEQEQLIHENPQLGDGFGRQVLLSDDFLMVSSLVSDTGAVHVYRRVGDQFIFSQLLIPNDGDGGDLFGTEMDLSGMHLAIGSEEHHGAAGRDSGAVYAYRLNGQSWVFSQKLEAIDGQIDDLYGGAVQVEGDVMMVGAYHHDSVGSNSGAVYVYGFNGGQWQHETKLNPADNSDFDRFGISLAMEGNRLAVGALYGSDNFNGSVYVYEFNGQSWQEFQEFTAGDLNDTGLFGNVVDLAGDRILVGAREEAVGGSGSTGVAYVFDFDGQNWSFTQSLSAGVNASAFDLGKVAIAGDQVMTTEPQDDTHGELSGALFVHALDNGTWVEEQKITTGPSSGGDEFGTSVDMSGEYIAVGSPKANVGAGKISIFQQQANQWSLVQEVDNQDNTFFFMGQAVSLDQERVLVGNGLKEMVQVFKLDQGSWDEEEQLVPSIGASTNDFGESVALSGTMALVGAPDHEVNGDVSGGVFVFEYINDAWTETQIIEPPVPLLFMKFGTNLFLDNDRLMVAATGRGEESAVYYYEYDGLNWVFVQKIEADLTVSFNSFGKSISLYGNQMVIAVGTSFGSDPKLLAYEHDGLMWNQTQVISSSASSLFNATVSMRQNLLVVGEFTYEITNGDEQPGGVLIFTHDGQTWSEQSALLAADGVSGQRFGAPVLLNGDHLVVGSVYDNDSGARSGSIYVYTSDENIFNNGFE